MGVITSPLKALDLTSSLTPTSQVEAQVTLGQIRGERSLPPRAPWPPACVVRSDQVISGHSS